MPEQFHFLQPLWFLLIAPMVLLLWKLRRITRQDDSWQQACEAHLLAHLLLPVHAHTNKHTVLWVLALAWLLGVFALADPVWEQRPQPVYQELTAVMIVLDLSRSMLSADLAPSRLERARFKVAEILKQRQQGQTGLVVFAGEAFVVSPLATDTDTIQSLLQPLHPELMPTQDSRADLGITLAVERLQQAGLTHGEIILVTDGYSDTRIFAVAAELKQQGYRLSVLAVGTDTPQPIDTGNGGFLRDRQGNIILPVMDAAQLQQLADTGGGHYSLISTDDSDLTHILSLVTAAQADIELSSGSADVWHSQGPWLVLLLLPLAALAFRRDWLLNLGLIFIMAQAVAPTPAKASLWDDTWQRRDQQTVNALAAGDPLLAQQLAEMPMRRGEAAYRAGQYENALAIFTKLQGAEADYNRGNTLAQLKRYKDAIAAYDQALASHPDMEDATHNKTLLEELLQLDASEGDGEKSDEASEQQGKSQGEGKGNTPGESPNEQQNEDQDGDQENQQAGNSGDPTDTDETSDEFIDEENAPDNKAESETESDQQAEQETDAEQQQAQNDQNTETQPDDTETDDTEAPLDTTTTEQQQADELRLRRVIDDPGGLLRRKFLYQYRKRAIREQNIGPQGQGW